MKNFTLLLLLFSAVLVVNAQSPRMVLHEEFTSSTCGPCASVNPGFHNWLVQHPDIYTAIYWHVNWPSPGNDPMYLANTAENSYRVGFYGVSSVPYAVVDGNYFANTGGYLTWNTIQTRSTMSSPFEIHIQHQLNAAQDSIFVTTLAKCTQAVTSSMLAHNVVIEKHIHFTNAPGTNGEKDFYNVMKKMLPGKEGTSLPGSFVPGDYNVMKYTWKLANVYTVSELAAVGFIQNSATKEIYQAANSSTDLITMPYNNDTELTEISNYASISCSGKVNPIVVIRNNGNNPLTAMEIKYKVNEEPVSTFSWSGNLSTLEEVSVTLPEYTYTTQPHNILKVFTNNPNNIADEYPKNDTLAVGIDASIVTNNSVLILVRTDNSPEETTWDIRDESGTVIESAGPYTQSMHMYRDTVDLPAPGCYTFTIYDAGGNGICCSNGSGVYTISTNAATPVVIKSGNQFGSFEFVEFSMDWATGIKEKTSEELKVFPNPSDGKTQLSFTNSETGNVTICLYNSFGRLVRILDMGIIQSGNQELALDAKDLPVGIYILKLRTEKNVFVKKIVLNR
jgi:hypothetical protein